MTMANGVFGPFLRDMGNNDKAFDLGGDTIKYVFVSNGLSPDFNTMDEYADISSNEVTGSGYTTGGEAISTPTWTIGSGYSTFDGADALLATTTLTNVRGICTIDDTLTGDPLIHATNFGADYSTVTGPFQLAWHANGIWRVDYIP